MEKELKTIKRNLIKDLFFIYLEHLIAFLTLTIGAYLLLKNAMNISYNFFMMIGICFLVYNIIFFIVGFITHFLVYKK